MAAPEKLFYSPRTAAELLDSSPSFINRMIREGRLPARQIGGCKKIAPEDFKRFVDEWTEPPSRRGYNAKQAIERREWRPPRGARTDAPTPTEPEKPAEPKAAPPRSPTTFVNGVAVE